MRLRMVATESSQPLRMLKPLVEKRRRDRINKNLEELRLLLLQKTHCQTLKNPKVEKAEILELAVGYLQEREKAAIPQGANPSEDDGLQNCYAMGFRACFGHLASFIRQSPPSVQRHLWETLHVYLASTFETSPPPDRTPSSFSPTSSAEESLAGVSEPTCSPSQPNRTFAGSDVASCSAGQLGGWVRNPRTPTREALVKNTSPRPTFWRPWP
ncbi:transcription factor HES-7-like isoform X2 [Erythrolamprus reginae]|uniref:transcription factor HES-7-like isoform X2 n=1 Tax=Erythrolamprus reginae TaxID=121349 RepID=UPI00396C40CF